jgi:hypothetical protein
MSYCPKCGNKVDETMTFCPRCGAPLKAEPAPRPTSPRTYRRDEKSEKGEKNEKNQQSEKGEKHEKGEFGHIGWLIGGIAIIVIGLLAYLQASDILSSRYNGAIVLLVIGIAVIIIALWISMTARRRNPAPPV